MMLGKSKCQRKHFFVEGLIIFYSYVCQYNSKFVCINADISDNFSLLFIVESVCTLQWWGKAKIGFCCLQK